RVRFGGARLLGSGEQRGRSRPTFATRTADPRPTNTLSLSPLHSPTGSVMLDGTGYQFLARVFVMRKLPLDRQRKWFGLGLLALIVAGVVWHFSPGLPVLFGPSASASAKQAGYELFVHEWQ